MVGEGEEEGKLIIEARVKRRCLSVRSAIFANMPPPPPSVSLCYLADALLFDALHRKDVLSGGGELHSRLDPIARGTTTVGGGVGEMLATAPVDVPSARCVLCALGSFPVVSKSNCIPSTSSLSSLARSLSLPPHTPRCWL